MTPKIQKPAPEFSGTAIVNGLFQEINLSDYKGQYLVFFFYPMDFTFVCPTEIIAFSDRFEDFQNIKCQVVACSTDSQFSHFAWVSTPRKQGGLGPMKIPLLSDKSMKIAKAYGVLDEETGVPFRGLFIIDGLGNLRQMTINDLPVGRSVDETLRLVQAFQFTDEFGEVCPSGWTPGKKTIKPDVEGKKEYFESQGEKSEKEGKNEDKGKGNETKTGKKADGGKTGEKVGGKTGEKAEEGKTGESES